MSMHQISITTPLARRAFRNRRIGIEPAGTVLQQLAQKLIHRERGKLNGLEGAVSFGRSVAAFLPALDQEDLLQLVASFRRVLLLGQKEKTMAAAESTRSLGADVSGGMPIIGADEIKFVPAARLVLSKFSRSFGGCISVVSEDVRASEIRGIQDLQIAVGLTPLPGAFLRGGHGCVSTVCYRDSEGRLLASATTVDLSDAGPDFMETSILVGVAVHPDVQGRGFGTAITAAGLLEAHKTLGARRVIAVVSPTNEVALHTNSKFHMHPLKNQTAIYLEMGGQA